MLIISISSMIKRLHGVAGLQKAQLSLLALDVVKKTFVLAADQKYGMIVVASSLPLIGSSSYHGGDGDGDRHLGCCRISLLDQSDTLALLQL